MLNVNSLFKHIDELRIMLSEKPVDTFAINELKLDATIADHEIHIDGYNIVRLDCNRHGVVFVLI